MGHGKWNRCALKQGTRNPHTSQFPVWMFFVDKLGEMQWRKKLFKSLNLVTLLWRWDEHGSSESKQKGKKEITINSISLPLSVDLQESHHTQRDRKETRRGRPQKSQHTHRETKPSLWAALTGILLWDKSAWKQPWQPAWKLFKASYSSHTPHLHPHLDSFLVSWKNERRWERGKKKKKKFSQSNLSVSLS